MKRKTENTVSLLSAGLELKKHVAIIHSSNKLTLLQRKIANALLFHAYGELQTKHEHTIHIAKLCGLIGYDSHDYKTIKQALVNLLSTVLEWNLVDGERLDMGGIWNASSIIADASIQGAYCTYSYSNRMRELLYRPHIYGRLDMQVQAQFKSGYGLALYENCNRFQDVGYTPWFDLAKFRKLMGVQDDQYKIFRDFKTRVLDKAVSEVNQYSSLVINAKLRKQNRKVVSIQFLITKPESSLNEHVELESQDAPLSQVLQMDFGFSSKQIDETIHRYDVAYIQEKIVLVRAAPSFKNGRVKHVARYLLSALRDDYQPQKNSAAVSSNHPLPSKASKPRRTKDDVIMQAEFKHFQNKELFGLYNKLPARSRSSILKKFEKFLTGMYQRVYLRSGLENLLVQEQLCIFIQQMQHKIVEKMTSYEEWVTSHARFCP